MKKEWWLYGSYTVPVTSIPEGIRATSDVRFTRGVVFNPSLRPVNPKEAVQFCLSDTALYPAMCLYMQSKPIQIGQSWITEQQRRWSEIIRNAKRVLVIGVQPYPSDTHVWTPLAETNASLGYIGPEEQFRDWTSMYRKERKSELLGERWEEAFDCAIDFLEGSRKVRYKPKLELEKVLSQVYDKVFSAPGL